HARQGCHARPAASQRKGLRDMAARDGPDLAEIDGGPAMTTSPTSRRRFVASGALLPMLSALPRWVQAGAAGVGADALSLWYDQPAGPWLEALPLGNGRLGAMVFGRPAQERLQFNIDTLYAGGPYVADNPAFLKALPEVRA